MASSLSVNRKRSRDDLEEGDDCLPISKRIHSLRIEGQTPGLNAQSSEHVLSPLAGFCDPQTVCNAPHDLGVTDISSTAQCNAVTGLDLTNGMACSERLPTIDEQGFSGHSENAQRHHASNSLPQFMRSFSEPCASYMNTHMNTNMSDHQMCGDPNSQPINPASFVTDVHYPQVSNHMTHTQQTENGFGPGQFNCTPHGQGNPQHQLGSSPVSQSLCPPMSVFPTQAMSPSVQHLMQTQSQEQFHFEQIPSGPYEPELDVSENPHYFSINQMLYEAHVSRTRRHHPYPESS